MLYKSSTLKFVHGICCRIRTRDFTTIKAGKQLPQKNKGSMHFYSTQKNLCLCGIYANVISAADYGKWQFSFTQSFFLPLLLPRKQCDQFERFLKVLPTNLPTKGAQKDGWLLGPFWKDKVCKNCNFWILITLPERCVCIWALTNVANWVKQTYYNISLKRRKYLLVSLNRSMLEKSGKNKNELF